MAQRIIGLDLGSRNIRVSIVETTLRTVELVGVDVEPVLQIPDAALVPDSGGEPEGDDAALLAQRREAARKDARRESLVRALKSLEGRGVLDADHVVTSMPGDRVVSRILEFPFSDPKRIAQIIGFELEEHIPFELEDVLVDHCILSSSEDGARVLASAIPMDDVSETLDILNSR